MKKKIFVCITVLFCLLIMPAGAAAEGLYVMDWADLLIPEEASALNAYLEGISVECGANIAVATVHSLEGSSAQAYADDLYDTDLGYFGLQDGTVDGALFLVAMEEREWAISTSGYGITAIHEGALDYMEEILVPYLSDGAYYTAFQEFGDICRAYWLTEPGDTPYGYYADPYYSDTYYGESAGSWFSPGSFLAVSLVIGFLIALIPMGVLKSQLNTVHMQTGAVSYQKTGGVRITDAKDLYLYRNVTKKPIPRDDPPKSGGSRPGGSVHIGSSGRSHGGRSGGF